MGLDQYAYVVDSDYVVDNFTFNGDVSNETWYWRKSRHLQGWMQNLYNRKGGPDASFNCSYVRLTKEDLEQLKIDASSLPAVSGFFWGNSELDEDEIANYCKFADEAIGYINDGYAIYYSSWY